MPVPRLRLVVSNLKARPPRLIDPPPAPPPPAPATLRMDPITALITGLIEGLTETTKGDE